MKHADAIARGGLVAHAYEAYAEDRITQLTAICTSRASSTEDIRGAQTAIQELRRIVDLRETANRYMQEGTR